MGQDSPSQTRPTGRHNPTLTRGNPPSSSRLPENAEGCPPVHTSSSLIEATHDRKRDEDGYESYDELSMDTAEEEWFQDVDRRVSDGEAGELVQSTSQTHIPATNSKPDENQKTENQTEEQTEEQTENNNPEERVTTLPKAQFKRLDVPGEATALQLFSWSIGAPVHPVRPYAFEINHGVPLTSCEVCVQLQLRCDLGRPCSHCSNYRSVCSSRPIIRRRDWQTGINTPSVPERTGSIAAQCVLVRAEMLAKNS